MTRRVFGDLPGIIEGDEFESRRALHDVGIHYEIRAGISGSAAAGAYSIVLSGGYEDDYDEGDVILYTGHGGRDLQSGRQVAHQTLERGNLALSLNYQTRLPVRVTRGYRHRSPFSPRSGYRYAGLYRVESYWPEVGKSGYEIWRYRLVKIDANEQVSESAGDKASGRETGMTQHTPQEKYTFDDDAQVVLYVERGDKKYDRYAFIGLPASRPALIVIASCNNDLAVREICKSIRERLIECLPTARMISDAVPVATVHPTRTSEFQSVTAELLLVLVSDGKSVIDAHPLAKEWPDNVHSRVLPAMPRRFIKETPRILGLSYRKLNAAFWLRSAAEVVPDVLAIAGLTTSSSRIFISYRRHQATGLAMQLFDALAHEGFDVFLDTLRIPPGVDFQSRLMEELAFKGMLLVLETTEIEDSLWTSLEIETAFRYGLGAIALHPPEGHQVPNISPVLREPIYPEEFIDTFDPNNSENAKLTDDGLKRITRAVKDAYAAAIILQRSTIQATVTAALTSVHLPLSSWQFDAYGVLEATDLSGSKHYRIWIAPRAPELVDFHDAFHHVQGHSTIPKGVVVGTTALLQKRTHERVAWLADRSNIVLADLLDFQDTAKAIADGTLL